VRDPAVTMTVVGLSTPRRLDALVESLASELSSDLFESLAALLPDRKHWLDFRAA
jgi:D-threo-aldose 1-dehydrogenase